MSAPTCPHCDRPLDEHGEPTRFMGYTLIPCEQAPRDVFPRGR